METSGKRYLVGSIHHISNRRHAINWIGPIGEFLREYAGKVPDGVALCKDSETVIRATRVMLSISGILEDRTDQDRIAALTQLVKDYGDANDEPSVFRARDKRLLTPEILLRLSAFLGDVRMCEMALEEGADINATGFASMSGVHWAAACDRVEVLKVLIARGARLDVANECSLDVLDLAASNRAVRACDFLKGLGFVTPGRVFREMLQRWGLT
jgi:hypothetical protein